MAVQVEDKGRKAEIGLREKERKAETAELLHLANDLKSESDSGGATSHPVSTAQEIDEIRKAEAIARLAHGLREKMESPTSNSCSSKDRSPDGMPGFPALSETKI